MKFIGIALALATMGANAQSQHAKLPGEDWISLFNGKDLSGWTEIGHEKWAVENGTIHGFAMTKDYGYLRDREEL